MSAFYPIEDEFLIGRAKVEELKNRISITWRHIVHLWAACGVFVIGAISLTLYSKSPIIAVLLVIWFTYTIQNVRAQMRKLVNTAAQECSTIYKHNEIKEQDVWRRWLIEKDPSNPLLNGYFKGWMAYLSLESIIDDKTVIHFRDMTPKGLTRLAQLKFDLNQGTVISVASQYKVEMKRLKQRLENENQKAGA